MEKRKLTQKELAEQRKRKQAAREMHNSLAKSLDDANKKQEDKERFYANKSRLVIGLINLIGTIVFFEIILFIAGLFFPIGFFAAYIRWFAIIVGGISAFMQRSLIDGWINRA